MIRTLSTLAIILFCSATLHAQESTIDPALAGKVRELIELTGSSDLAGDMMQELLPALKELAPGVPEKVWADLEKEMKMDGLMEELIPIYVEEYTVAEIDAMLNFYRTPEGRSVLQKMPNVMQRSMQVGQEWGQRAAERVFERLQDKGYAPKS